MEIKIQARFHTEEISWLCFRHAILRALSGEDVELELDDYDSEYYHGPRVCEDCKRERAERCALEVMMEDIDAQRKELLNEFEELFPRLKAAWRSPKEPSEAFKEVFE